MCLRDDAFIWKNTAPGLKSLFDQAKMKEHLCSCNDFSASGIPEHEDYYGIVMGTAADSPGSSDQRNSENRYLGQQQLLGWL